MSPASLPSSALVGGFSARPTMFNPYIIGAAVIAYLAIGGYGLYQRSEAAQERVERVAAQAEAARISTLLDEAVRVNKRNAAVLAEMERQSMRDAALAASLQNQLQVSTDSQLALAQRLAAIKAGNPDVQKMLDSRIPDDVLRLYRNRP
jgi:hypothetical protein